MILVSFFLIQGIANGLLSFITLNRDKLKKQIFSGKTHLIFLFIVALCIALFIRSFTCWVNQTNELLLKAYQLIIMIFIILFIGIIQGYYSAYCLYIFYKEKKLLKFLILILNIITIIADDCLMVVSIDHGISWCIIMILLIMNVISILSSYYE